MAQFAVIDIGMDNRNRILQNLKVYRYALPDGWVVLVGRTERDNDVLSLRVAAQSDYWFHAKGVPGSHVILKDELGESRTPDAALLKVAAAVAAYHSKARKAGITPVNCTQARHVGKPRGAKPGLVTIQKEKTIKVRPALPVLEGERIA